MPPNTPTVREYVAEQQALLKALLEDSARRLDDANAKLAALLEVANHD